MFNISFNVCNTSIIWLPEINIIIIIRQLQLAHGLNTYMQSLLTLHRGNWEADREKKREEESEIEQELCWTSQDHS